MDEITCGGCGSNLNSIDIESDRQEGLCIECLMTENAKLKEELAKANVEYLDVIRRYAKTKEVIEAALRIRDLWRPGRNCDCTDRDEAVALWAMATKFDLALKEPTDGN